MTDTPETSIQARFIHARNFPVAQRAMSVHYGFIPYGMEREDIESVAANAYAQFYRTGKHLASDTEDDERARLFVFVSTAITNEKRLIDRLSRHSRAMLTKIHRQQRADFLAGRAVAIPRVEGIPPAKVKELLEMELTSQHVALPDEPVLAESGNPFFDDSPEVLREAVAKLPPKERAAVELNVLEGWSAKQIAAELGKCETSALKMIRRGLLRLSKMPEVRELSR